MHQPKISALTAVACLVAGAVHLWAAQRSAPGVPASMVVTLEPKHGKTIPQIDPSDIKVTEANEPRPITGLETLRGGKMQLLLMIDDSARASLDTELQTIKQFVTSLPANIEIAIGYMRNGMTEVVQNFTSDHAAAANNIRVATGTPGSDVSPYDSLSDAIKKWPKPGAQRREVIMISSGIEALGGGFAPDNPYVNKGIEEAQRAGVVVYAVYNPSSGHFGHTFWRETWGQNFLSQLSDETGGEAYITTIGPPVTFQPYLENIRAQFDNQYLLTFLARPEKKSGLQPVKVRIIEKDADIAAPDRVYIKASL